MKSTLPIISFFLNLLNCTIAGHSNTCIGQTYTTGTDSELEAQYLREFSTFKHLRRKWTRIFNPIQDPYWINEPMSKELCACAFYKKKEKVAKATNTPIKPFEEILKGITFQKTYVYPKIKYLFIPITCEVPVIICSFGDEKCDLLKGFRQKSSDAPIYDIYVGYAVVRNGAEKLDFEGVIHDVNVEQSSVPKN